MKSNLWPAVFSLVAGVSACNVAYFCPDFAAPCDSLGAAPDAGAARCSGQCEEASVDGWSSPVLLWIGTPGQAPACPPEAPATDYEGFADPLEAPPACSACACSAPTGKCAPPVALTAASMAACPATAGDLGTRGFDAPPGWDGACTSANAIPAGEQCAGGLCTQSLTIAPLALTESRCTPILPVPPLDPVTPYTGAWSTAARSCFDPAPGTCRTPGAVCAPGVAPGLARCIHQSGDVACPSGWPERHLFFGDAEDSRGCSPCGCGLPTGSLCTGLLSVYTDGSCTSLLTSVSVASSAPSCVVFQPAGEAVGSKALTLVDYQPGVCLATGGEPVGSVTPTDATTFCCQP
jgi:hypothetical protein